MNRQCFLRIQVVASGDWTHGLADQLTVGDVVEVEGFLNRHQTSSGIAKLVLHAQQLKKI